MLWAMIILILVYLVTLSSTQWGSVSGDCSLPSELRSSCRLPDHLTFVIGQILPTHLQTFGKFSPQQPTFGHTSVLQLHTKCPKYQIEGGTELSGSFLQSFGNFLSCWTQENQKELEDLDWPMVHWDLSLVSRGRGAWVDHFQYCYLYPVFWLLLHLGRGLQ